MVGPLAGGWRAEHPCPGRKAGPRRPNRLTYTGPLPFYAQHDPMGNRNLSLRGSRGDHFGKGVRRGDDGFCGAAVMYIASPPRYKSAGVSYVAEKPGFYCVISGALVRRGAFPSHRLLGRGADRCPVCRGRSAAPAVQITRPPNRARRSCEMQIAEIRCFSMFLPAKAERPESRLASE